MGSYTRRMLRPMKVTHEELQAVPSSAVCDLTEYVLAPSRQCFRTRHCRGSCHRSNRDSVGSDRLDDLTTSCKCSSKTTESICTSECKPRFILRDATLSVCPVKC